MRKDYWLDLQFFADGGAPAGEGGGEAAGVSTPDAGESFEARLEELNVPKDKIRKGAYKNAAKFQKAQPAAAPEEQAEESGAADRKSWDDIKGEYKDEYDAEVQSIVQKRLKNAQEKMQQYSAREESLAPLIDFFAAKYGAPTRLMLFAAAMTGVAATYAVGVAYLYAVLNIWGGGAALMKVLSVGFFTTFPGDIIKAAAAAEISRRVAAAGTAD